MYQVSVDNGSSDTSVVEVASPLCLGEGIELAAAVKIESLDTLCGRTVDGGLLCQTSEMPAEWFSSLRSTFETPYQPEMGFVTQIATWNGFFVALDDDGRMRIWKPDGQDISVGKFH